MAVISADELSVTGSTSEKGRSYSSTYLVQTNSDNDSSAAVLDHFMVSSSLPYRGDAFSFGNDIDITSFANTLNAKRPDKNRRRQWIVEVQYTPLDEKQNEEKDEQGNPTTDPRKWRPIVSMSSRSEQIVADDMEYDSGYKEDNPADSGTLLRANNHRTPCNSAFVPFDPPVMTEHQIQIWNVKFNSGERLSDADNTINAIIDSRWEIDTAKVLKTTPQLGDAGVFQADNKEAKVTSISIEPKIINGIGVWVLEYEFHIDRRTWVVEVADRGWDARYMKDDPDGHGGQAPAALDDGVPRLRPIKIRGQRPSSPVNLNGNGQAMDPPNGDTVYSTWTHKGLEVPIGNFDALMAKNFIRVF